MEDISEDGETEADPEALREMDGEVVGLGDAE